MWWFSDFVLRIFLMSSGAATKALHIPTLLRLNVHSILLKSKVYLLLSNRLRYWLMRAMNHQIKHCMTVITTSCISYLNILMKNITKWTSCKLDMMRLVSGWQIVVNVHVSVWIQWHKSVGEKWTSYQSLNYNHIRLDNICILFNLKNGRDSIWQHGSIWCHCKYTVIELVYIWWS